MYTHILTKYRARKSFVTRSYLFNTQNKSFRDRVIYPVPGGFSTNVVFSLLKKSIATLTNILNISV